MQIVVIAMLVFVAVFILLTRSRKPPRIETVGGPYEREIVDADFDMVLEKSKETPVLVDFYANWCGPCRVLTPLLAQIANDYRGAFLLAKVDTDTNPLLKVEYGIEAIPTVMLFKDGVVVERFVGGKLEHSIRYSLAQHGISAPSLEAKG